MGVVSFFLLVLGSYYLGIYWLEWSKESTLKLTLVVTIIVFFAEAFLLIIKMHREDTKTYRYKASDNIRNNSLAYKLNAKYRESFNQNEKDRKSKVKVADSSASGKE